MKSQQDYITLGRIRCFEWLGSLPRRVIDPSSWRCSNGHIWQASYNSISSGRGCPFCSNHVPKAEKDYALLAEEKGFIWAEQQIPRTTHDKTKWSCKKGHFWIACYKDIKSGNKCPHCSNRARKTEQDYHNLAERRGFKWLGPKMVRTHISTSWKCNIGHVFSASFDKLQRGRGCKYCSNRVKHLPEDYHSLALKHGFQWLEETVKNNHTKTRWRCSQGHIWAAPYKSINNKGSGCPICAGLAPKIPSHYRVLANERGLKWLGPEVPNTMTKTKWLCPNGHEFEAPYNNVQYNFGCTICAGLTPKIPEDYKELASKNGLQWLGPEVPNVMAKTKWACKSNHEWEATYDSIRTGSGCPDCQNIFNGARVSENQIILCKQLGGELNYKLKKMKIDIAIIDEFHKIAIEYDCWYWHGNKLEDDNKRDAMLLEAGWKVLRILTKDSLPKIDIVLDKISELRGGKNKEEIILEDWGKGPCFTKKRN